MTLDTPPDLLKRPLLAAAALFATLFAAGAHAASATQTPWSVGPISKARLVAAGGPDPGQQVIYRAGIEIEMVNGAHTYWRQPGDAGVPPQVSFEGSQNVKSAELRYPAPTRIDENGLKVFGYRQNVMLPIEVRPENPTVPVRLKVRFQYAACDKICIPAEADGTLDLAPNGGRGSDAGRLMMAAVALPDRVANGSTAQLTAQPVQGRDKPTWRVNVDRPRGPWRDLFVEAPEGWFFDAKRVGDAFEIVAAEQPADAKAPPQVTLTLTGPRDYEVKVALPAR